MAQRRDPDALPPGNTFEAIMNILYRAFQGISHGNQLFAIKAGVLTSQYLQMTLDDIDVFILEIALLSIPSFLRSSASFAYGTFSESTW